MPTWLKVMATLCTARTAEAFAGVAKFSTHVGLFYQLCTSSETHR